MYTFLEKKVYRPPGLTWGCPDPGLNRGPLDLQSNALPTELSRPVDSKLKITSFERKEIH